MVTPELVTYVREELIKGVDKSTITTQALASGWTQESIVEAFVSAESLIDSKATHSPMSKRRYFMIGAAALIVITAFAAAFFFWRSSQVGTTYSQELENSIIPDDWVRHESNVGPPGYTARISVDWRVSENQNASMFVIGQDAMLTVSRSLDKNSFSELFTLIRDKTPSTTNVIGSGDAEIDGNQVKMIEYETGLATEAFAVREIYSEVVHLGVRWTVTLSIERARSGNKDSVERYRDWYFQFMKSFSPS